MHNTKKFLSNYRLSELDYTYRIILCAINKNDIKQKKIMIKYIFSSVNMKIYFTSLKYMNIKLHISTIMCNIKYLSISDDILC